MQKSDFFPQNTSSRPPGNGRVQESGLFSEYFQEMKFPRKKGVVKRNPPRGGVGGLDNFWDYTICEELPRFTNFDVSFFSTNSSVPDGNDATLACYEH